jgi:hypothetical protein
VTRTDAGLGLSLGLMQRAGEAGTGEDDEAMGASHAPSRPLCGLRRSRIDNKCSQLWYPLARRKQT